ncbi:MAG: DUF2589 domain-containing protein [Cyanobacteria bacterium P01_G01_bin.54]
MMSEQIEFRGLTASNLVGLPAVAVVKANQMMAREQVSLLMQNCFSEVDGVYHPKMVTMAIHRGEVEPRDEQNSLSIHPVALNFQVPLITLIPINSLAVEDVNTRFSMDVHAYHEASEEDKNRPLEYASSSNQSYELIGNIQSTSHYLREGIESPELQASSVSFDFSVKKLPLPLGISTILQAYTRTIHPSDTSQEQTSD